MIRQIFLRFVRDPLFHFLVLGAGLFMIYFLVKGFTRVPADRIVFDETQAIHLVNRFHRTMMRPPTRQELQNLAEEYVKEEILYREAQKLGLDQDDLVIRRRLRQKMEFLNADLVETESPTDAQLQTYFDDNKNKFIRPALFSFQQVYLNPYKEAGGVKQSAAEILAHLNADPKLAADPNSFGDATMLPARLDSVTRREVANTFGRGFAKDIDNAPTGRWSGPYESSYGLHLVHMTKREAGDLPAMEEIRPILLLEWYNERRKEVNDRFYQAIRAHYDVEIRLPDDGAGKTFAVK